MIYHWKEKQIQNLSNSANTKLDSAAWVVFLWCSTVQIWLYFSSRTISFMWASKLINTENNGSRWIFLRPQKNNILGQSTGNFFFFFVNSSNTELNRRHELYPCKKVSSSPAFFWHIYGPLMKKECHRWYKTFLYSIQDVHVKTKIKPISSTP